MAHDSANKKRQAHELIERLTPSQVNAVVDLLEAILDPVSRKLAAAPLDDEPETEEERQAVAEANDWLKHNKPIPFEDVLADFGLTLEDVKKHQDSE